MVILEERADGGPPYVCIDGMSSMIGMAASFPSERDPFAGRERPHRSRAYAAATARGGAHEHDRVCIIGGGNYTTTDAEARAIMLRLAAQGVTEAIAARTPYRVLVNMILRARRELDKAAPPVAL